MGSHRGCPYRSGGGPREGPCDGTRLPCRGNPWSQSQKSGSGGMPEPPPDRERLGDGAILGLMRQAPCGCPPQSPIRTGQSQCWRSPTRRLSDGGPEIPPNRDSCDSLQPVAEAVATRARGATRRCPSSLRRRPCRGGRRSSARRWSAPWGSPTWCSRSRRACASCRGIAGPSCCRARWRQRR